MRLLDRYVLRNFLQVYFYCIAGFVSIPIVNQAGLMQISPSNTALELTKNPGPSGKGAPEGWVVVIKPGRVLFEMGGVTPEMAKRAFQLAAYKLPMKTRTLGIKSGVKAAADVKIKGPAEVKPGEGVEGIAGAAAAPTGAAAAAPARGPKAAPGAAPSVKPAPGAAPKAAPGAAPKATAAAPAKPAKGGGKK